MFTFISLEESVTAILYEAGAATLPMTRSKTAGGKESALQDLADRYRASPAGTGIADALESAVAAFRAARQSIRNELFHAHPFTVGADSDGRYMPGLAYTAKDGRSWKTIARSPNDVLDLATAIEEALEPLNVARVLVEQTPLSSL